MPATSMDQDPPDIEDQRYLRELLKPIKDLTQNWEVPLSEILSGYMENLEQVTITLDGGQTSLNFAEAALVLQGSAAVYSKKVDFLNQLANKMAELLATNNVQDQDHEAQEGLRGPRVPRRRNEVPMEFEDIHVALGRNLQLKSEEDSISIREKKEALRFINITPSQLVEKEGSEQKAIKVNLFTGGLDSRWDLLASKEDFRINCQYVLNTGYLGEELNEGNVYTEFNPVPDDSSVEVENSLHGEMEAMEALEVLSDSRAVIQELPELMLGQNNSTASERTAGQNLSNSLSLSHSSMSGRSNLLVSPPSSSSWQPLDPHKQLRTPKPLKIKQRRKLPPSLRGKKKSAQPIIPISQFLTQDSHLPDQPRSLPHYIPLSCYHLVENQKELKKNEEARERLFHQEEEEEEIEEFAAWDPEPVDEEDFEFNLKDPHLGGELGALAVENMEAENDSLEELLAKKVEEFLIKSKEAMTNDELAQRVSRWHEMIGPRLERLETRNVFDIHDYGTRILNQCQAAGTEEVAFRDIVRGQKKEEISRYFLSSLMLANSGNVEISTSGDEDLGMDNINLALLSTVRHHQDLEEFPPHRQQERESQEEDSAARGDKRQHSLSPPREVKKTRL